MAGTGAAIGKAGAAISQRGEQRRTATEGENTVAEMNAGGYTEGNMTGKEGITHGQRAESKEDFYRRGVAEGLSYLERDEGGYAFQRVRYPAGAVVAERYSPAQGIQRELSALGISSDIIEGELQRNHKGVTTTFTVEEAATADRGHIFINKNTTLNPRNVAGHEAFHLWGNSETRTAYEAVLRENLIFSAEAFREYQAKATWKYFEGEADLTDPKQAKLLFEEIFAYISGDLHEGIKEGTLREILRDYDAVKAAWEQLVQENGNGNKEVTDYGTEGRETDLHRGGMAGGLPNLDGNEGGGTVQRVRDPAGTVAAGRDGTVEGKQVNRTAAHQPRVAEVTAEGSIVMPRGGETGKFYLPTAEQERVMRQAAKAQTETERTGILAGASEKAIAQAQRLGEVIGREVVFYSEAPDSLGNLRNGYYDPGDGRIYVNTQSGNPLPQIVAHELTHSLEESGSYRDLERLVLKRLQQQGSLDALRQAYQDLYARAGVELDTRGVDREIVAAYVEKKLLTDEGEIRNVVTGNRTLGKRILTFLNQLLGKLGNEAAAERAFLLKARSIYEAALEESRIGAEELNRKNANRRGIEELREQLSRGEITEEEAEDRFNDLYDPEEDLERRERGVRNSFGGEKARNADLDALEKAKEMQQQGVAEETIFRETGWYVGADGKWRFEIDDSGMEFRKDGDARLLEEDGYRRLQELTDKWQNSFADGEMLSEAEQAEMEQLQEEYSEAVREEKYRLTDFLKHDELFEQYPRLRGVSLVFDSLGDGERGYFSKRSNTIVLSDSLFGREADVLIHEIQHVLQRYEGFATGSSPAYWEKRMEEGYSKRDSHGIERMPSELYRNTAGEIEARDVTARRELSKEQRREKMPDRGNEDTVFAEKTENSFDFVGKTADGTEVYETSEDVRKMPIKQRMKVFESLMRNEYRGRTAKLVSGSEILYAKFDERDISKNIYGDKKSSKGGWKAKINVGADGDIFELVENSRYDHSKSESGKDIAAHKNVDKWEYFVKTVQIDGQVFDLLANIRKKPDGEFVYSIQLNENKKKAPVPLMTPAYNDKDLSNGYALNRVLANASGDSIFSEAENVKGEKSSTGDLEPEFTNPAWREAVEAGREQRRKNSISVTEEARKEKAEQENRTEEKLEANPHSARERIPAKARGQMERTERALVNRIGKALGVPNFGQREYLKPIVQEISDEYLRTGQVSEKTAERLFDKAYSEGIVTEDEFYRQYKPVKDHLRTQAITISEQDKADIADWKEFRKSTFGTLRIVNKGGVPVDVAYQELVEMAPELFTESVTAPSDQLRKMFDIRGSVPTLHGMRKL